MADQEPHAKYLSFLAEYNPTTVAGLVKATSLPPSSSSLRIKVRMTRTQLKELMRQAGSSHGNSELGSMILRESLDGRFRARVVVGDDDEGLVSSGSEYGKNLCAIKEE
ncbi:hypothetical protein OIU78_015517 [Salix suchowensis]|nr:hypothetical protein OIU78_015517 [Salix suchowensis]